MVLDFPVILHVVLHGAPRTGKAYYEDVLDGGRCSYDYALAFATLMLNGHDVQQQPHRYLVFDMVMRNYCPS